MTQKPIPTSPPPAQISAIADIAGLVAACQRLNRVRYAPIGELQSKTCGQLRRDIRRGTMAYVDMLTRSRRARLDEALLRDCRLAAERFMPLALAHQPDLCRFMTQEGGESNALAAIRQDIWRLLQLIDHLGAGLNPARRMSDAELAPAEAMIVRLHRRLRLALQAYVRAVLRRKANANRQVMRARADALAEIGPRGATQAERLADIEADIHASLSQLRFGVARPLLDLAVDWQRPHMVVEESLLLGS